MQNQDHKYLNEIGVSEMTSIPVQTLRNKRFEGIGIPYIKFGRSIRYSLQDVIDFMESHRIRTEVITGG